MRVDNALQPSTSYRTYYSPTRTLGFVLCGALTLLLLARWIADLVSGKEIFGFLLFDLLTWLSLGAHWLYRAWHSRIVISPEGIEYHQAEYCICTAWEKVERIAIAHIEAKPVDVLTLPAPSLQVSHKWLVRTSDFDRLGQIVLDGQFIPPGKAIPISLIVPDWRRRQLGRDVQQYVPHLMTTGNNQHC